MDLLLCVQYYICSREPLFSAACVCHTTPTRTVLMGKSFFRQSHRDGQTAWPQE